MKIKIYILIITLTLFPTIVFADSGCCSHHGGVDCSRVQSNGKVICNDGWMGSSCSFHSMVKCKNDGGFINKSIDESNENEIANKNSNESNNDSNNTSTVLVIGLLSLGGYCLYKRKGSK